MSTKKKELLFSVTKKDCEFQYFRASGPGGQHKNKVETAARCIHRESGAVAEATDSRSKDENTRNAFLRMINTEKFKNWHKAETARRMQNFKSIEDMVESAVNSQMAPQNLKVEVLGQDSRWVPYQEGISD